MSTRPHLSFCACQTASLGPELLVSMGSSPHLLFCALKTATLEPKLHVSMGPGLHLWFCACKTECLASEILVPMVPVLICGFCMQKNDFRTRITSLYGSQTWPVDLCIQKAWLAPESLVSKGPSPNLWFLHAKQRLLDQNYKFLWVHGITCRFVHAKQRDLHQNDKSIWVPGLICVFFSSKTAPLRPDLQVCMGPRPHLWLWAHITACLAQE